MTSDLLEENADLRKQVEELENELTAEKEYNATLRKEIDEYTNSHTLCTKYKELEKENAELKSIADFQTSSNMDRYFQLKRSKEQLTNAKEIIRDFLSVAIDYIDKEDKNYTFIVEAEQFLKEE